jgi:DNA-binding NarL/FixJ family response regulator
MSEDVRQVLVVDDHPIMRQGIAQLVNQEPDLNVCAEAANATAAMDLARRHKPSIALLDITLPGRNGLELIKDMLSELPETKILVVSMHDEAVYAERVLKAGGRGYIMKQSGGKKVIEGIRAVLAGRIFVSEQISARILENFGTRPTPGFQSVGTLTDRELEVFELLGQGRSTREIAETLGVSVKTIEAHRVNIKRKVGAKTVPELIRLAVTHRESSSW